MAFISNPENERFDAAAAEQLLHTLYTVDARLTTTQLLDYDLGLSTSEEARLIERYLTTDPTIRAELAQLQALNQPVTKSTIAAAEPSFATRFLAWLSAQWPDRLPLLAIPELSPATTPALRGAADAHAVYAVGAYRLALTITTTGGSQASDPTNGYTLQGQLLNQEVPDEICTGTVQLIHLPSDGQQEAPTTAPTTASTTPNIPPPITMAEATLDDFGFFALQIATTGTYRLVAALPQHTIWIQGLTVP